MVAVLLSRAGTNRLPLGRTDALATITLLIAAFGLVPLIGTDYLFDASSHPF